MPPSWSGSRRSSLRADLEEGPLARGRWVNVFPCIAEFLSDDIAYIEIRKSEIPEDEWARARVCGERWIARGTPPRDGRPFHAWRPRQT